MTLPGYGAGRYAAFALVGLLAGRCESEPQPAATPYTDRNNLGTMETIDLSLKEQAFRVWVARTHAEQQFGLMHVTQEQMAADAEGVERGMLFVFPSEHQLSFWMHNTIIPLDIAYLRSDGTVVKIYTMPPLETRTFPSIEPARFALEVSAGKLAALGVFEGDRIELPDAVLKPSP